MSDLTGRLEKIKEELSQFTEETKGNKQKTNENIELLKKVKLVFAKQFGGLVDSIGCLPEITTVVEEEVSPAAIQTQVFWEWNYVENSTKQFKKEGDRYALTTNDGYNTIMAYSSVSTDDVMKFQVQFFDTQSFGCGGFGCISKDDPDFIGGRFTSSTHPLFCLCCNGTWGAKSIQTKGDSEALQHKLKRDTEKKLTFEINITEGYFKIFYPDENTLYADSEINSLNFKTNMVLIFYSGSTVIHSHEIVPL